MSEKEDLPRITAMVGVVLPDGESPVRYETEEEAKKRRTRKQRRKKKSA